MEYFLKASAVMILFYLCYVLFLKRETFFEHNRWFLLVGLVIALVFPMIIIPVYITIEPLPVLEPVNFVSDNFISTSITTETPFDWLSLIPIIYGIGLLAFTIRFLLQFGSLISLLIKNPKSIEGAYTYIVIKNNISPFSFFKWIVFNPEQFKSEELALILNHEKVHVRQKHSIDMLLSELVSIVFWFNPLIWFYKKDIQQNLEYIADYQAQNTSENEKDYQRLLLKISVAHHNMSLPNNFYNSLIKKRIVMLHKSRSKTSKQWKYVLVLPILSVLFTSMNIKEIFVENESQVTVSNKMSKEKSLEFVVTKNTTDSEFTEMIAKIKAKGGDLKIYEKKRNSKNELTDIYLLFYSYIFATGDKENPIKPFLIYKEDSRIKNSFGFVSNVNDATKIYQLTDVDLLEISDEVIYKNQKQQQLILLKKGLLTNKQIEEYNKNKFEAIKKEKGKPITVFFHKDLDSKKLEGIKSQLKRKGIEFNIAQLERNDKGEITVINVNFKLESGGTANYNLNNNKPISPFYFKKEGNGAFRVATVETKGNNKTIYILDGKEIVKAEYLKLKKEFYSRFRFTREENPKVFNFPKYKNRSENTIVFINSKNDKNTKITGGFEINANNSSSMANFIDATTSNETLNRYKLQLKKEKNIDVAFSNMKRNSKEELTSIKIAIDDNKGSKASATWENKKIIPQIEFGKNSEGVFVRTKQ